MKTMLFLLIVVIASFIAACSSPKEQTKCPCQVKIVELQDDGSYQIKVVSIQTIQDLDSVSGSVVQMGIDPESDSSGKIKRIAPKAQYVVTKDNVVVPTTAISLELFAIYKNMEDLYRLDLLTGADQFVRYPVGIHYETRMGGRQKKHNGVALNNAFYSRGSDQIVILKYVEDGQPLVPMSLNPGILAHEHFHQIFQKIVQPERQTLYRANLAADTGNSLPEKVLAPQGFNYLFLKAMNEGMADFWAYIHTGSETSFYASEQSDQIKIRTVSNFVFPFASQEALREALDYDVYIKNKLKETSGKKTQENSGENSVGKFVFEEHYLAPAFSRFARAVSESSFDIDLPKTQKEKEILGKWTIESMKRFSQTLFNKGDDAEITPKDFVKALVPSLPEDKEKSQKICEAIKELLKYQTGENSGETICPSK